MKYLKCQCDYTVAIGRSYAFNTTRKGKPGKAVVLYRGDGFKPKFMSYQEWKDEYPDCVRFLRKWL